MRELRCRHVWRGRQASCRLDEKMRKGTSHKPTKEVTDHNAPDTATWLLSGEPAPVRDQWLLGRKNRCFVIQNKAAQLRGVATGARCCSFTGTAQVCKERVGGEHDRDLRLELQKRRVQGLVRLGGSPGWVAQLGKGVLRQRGQGAGDEGGAGCGEPPLADQSGCTLRAAALLGRRNWRLGVTLSGWDATGGTLKEQLPPAGLDFQQPPAPLWLCEAVGAGGAVEQQAGQEPPQCPGSHLSGGILGPRDINCPKSQRERCTERRSSEDFFFRARAFFRSGFNVFQGDFKGRLRAREVFAAVFTEASSSRAGGHPSPDAAARQTAPRRQQARH